LPQVTAPMNSSTPMPAFHDVIAGAPGNGVLRALFRSCRRARCERVFGTASPNAAHSTLARDEHKRIYDAIVAGDANLARARDPAAHRHERDLAA